MPCSAEMLATVEFFEHLNDEDRARLAEVVDVLRRQPLYPAELRAHTH